VVLIQFFSGKSDSFLWSPFGNLTGDYLNFTLFAGPPASANTDNIHTQLPATLQKGLLIGALSMTTYWLEINSMQYPNLLRIMAAVYSGAAGKFYRKGISK
jgi:hypothetical protein